MLIVEPQSFVHDASAFWMMLTPPSPRPEAFCVAFLKNWTPTAISTSSQRAGKRLTTPPEQPKKLTAYVSAGAGESSLIGRNFDFGRSVGVASTSSASASYLRLGVWPATVA